MLDKRYTTGREFTGHKLPRYVLRFCGEYLSEHATKAQAVKAGIKAEKERQKFLGRLPVRDGVEFVTYYRQPTKSEIRQGYGATHYRDFALEECCDVYNGQHYLKSWFKAGDGLRYYR